jgi:hypothetical protein
MQASREYLDTWFPTIARALRWLRDARKARRQEPLETPLGSISCPSIITGYLKLPLLELSDFFLKKQILS